LAIVKKIMEDHSGKLTLDDRPDGPGAIASLSLPLTSAGSSTDVEENIPAGEAVMAGERTQVSHGA
jgi:two-component system, NtrC family, nitrogen regulation sensor histidine kinase NtrY